MPIRALVSGREVIAPLLDSEEWLSLKQEAPAGRGVLLPCCDAPGFLRTSKLGTQHFVHKSGHHCSSGGETVQHLWAKAEILAACTAEGWDARPEVAGDGWRADVLAVRGSARVAFEVQWSPQEEEICEFRQDRYARDGIRGCWLFRGDPPTVATAELPVFRIGAGEDGEHVVVLHRGRTYSVREFVSMLLNRRIRFSPTMRTALRICFVDMPCWRCGAEAHFYYARRRSLCGHTINGHVMSHDAFDSVSVDAFAPDVRAAVKEWLASEDGAKSGVRLGEIKKRYSKTMSESYDSFGCPSCDAIFGNWFVRDAMLDAVYDEPQLVQFEVESPLHVATAASDGSDKLTYSAKGSAGQAHWCVGDEDGRLCGSGAASKAAAELATQPA